MRIPIFGAGYVGCVTSACLAKMGHSVTVIDSVPSKIETIRSGTSPVLEEGLGQLIAEGVASGRLRGELDPEPSLLEADIAMICVGTPSMSNGLVDSGAMSRVLQHINRVIANRPHPLTVVIRSTILGSVFKKLLREIERATGKLHFHAVINPEFLRETTAVADFFRPPFVIVGGEDDPSLEETLKIYEGIDVPRYKVSLESASMIKYASNAFHALKISFANEIDTLATLIGADGREVMNLVTKDKILNISEAYLKPGFAFGGSCLPKDLRALEALGREHHEPLNLLASILRSNRRRIDQTLEVIIDSPSRRLAFVGLSFKAGSDDLRESPYVEIAERLLGKGFEIKIYDPDLDPPRLVGSNMAHVLGRLPHLARILVDSFEAACANADGIVLCKRILAEDRIQKYAARGVRIFDLQRMGLVMNSS